MNRPPAPVVIEQIVGDECVAGAGDRPGRGAIQVDAVIVILVVGGGGCTAVLARCEPPDIVQPVPFDADARLFDENADFTIGRIGAQPSDVVEVIMGDHDIVTSVEQLDARAAPRRIPHAVDLEAVEGDVIGVREKPETIRARLFRPSTLAPPTCRALMVTGLPLAPPRDRQTTGGEIDAHAVPLPMPVYTPSSTMTVSPAFTTSAARWSVRKGCSSVPGLLSLPPGDT